MARIICYDGVGLIGGNKILLEDKEAKIWFDFGTNFSTVSMFYEEFLSPKACLGLYEPLQMGLLPRLKGLYRADLVTELADPWEGVEAEDVGDVSGIIISHAHLDHIGAIHYVTEDIPIYCSAMTAAIARASQDTGRSVNDLCYVIPRETCETGGLVSTNHRKVPSNRRPFYLVEEQPSEAFLDFWDTSPGVREIDGPSLGESTTCGGMRLRRYPVDHSIYGACAWSVETGAGTVVYTGDIRCHGRNGALTLRFAEEVSKLQPRVLIIEGTRIASNRGSTEEDVASRAFEEVKKATGLVVADFGPRNVERLDTFLRIAKETDRQLLVTIKDAYLLECMGLVDSSVPSLEDESIGIYDEFEARSDTWKKSIKARFQHKLVEPQNVKTNQGEYICCFSFLDVNELAYLKPIPGSIWIYSSCEPFNEEMVFDMKRLRAWLDHFAVAPLGIADEDERNPFHVSGHASRDDLLKVIDIINPSLVIPVHLEERNLPEYVRALEGRRGYALPEKGVPIEI